MNYKDYMKLADIVGSLQRKELHCKVEQINGKNLIFFSVATNL